MLRLTKVSIFALTVAGMASAGQFYVGGSSGLTAAYLGTANANLNTAGNPSERSYGLSMWTGVKNGAALPQPYAGYSQTVATTANTTLTDARGVSFEMVADGLNGTLSNNYWTPTAAGSSSLVVPINVSNVTSVYSMLNTIWTNAAANDSVSVEFDFCTDSSCGTLLTPITVALTNSPNPGGGGQIRGGIDCSTIVPGSCPTFPYGPLAGSTPNLGGTGVSVSTSNIYSFSYTGANTLFCPAGSTSCTGTAVLDDQGFNFDALYANHTLLAGDFLEQIVVKQSNSNTSGLQGNFGLSAVTVATPEPSTILLLLSGIGAFGFKRFRRQ